MIMQTTTTKETTSPSPRPKVDLWDTISRYWQKSRYRWPIYDLTYYFANLEPRRLYRRNGSRMKPLPIEQDVIQSLNDTGIAVIDWDQLFPTQSFAEVKDWAEQLLDQPQVREKIKALERGMHDAQAWKYYLVRPLGTRPVLDINEAVMKMALSEPVLRIVCGYLKMLARLTAVDLWYNVATEGPDVFSQRWHRDPEDKSIVKTFLYLRDVEESNGPFCYIPGSHNRGPFKDFYPHAVANATYPDAGVVEARFSPEMRKVLTGKAGTLVFCDTSGFHRGGNPTGAARLLFNSVFTTNASQPILEKARLFTVHGFGSEASSVSNCAVSYALSHLRAT
jgi:hypothetical protein